MEIRSSSRDGCLDPRRPHPNRIQRGAQNPDWLVSAFNDQFERLMEQHIMGPRYGWPTVSIERHRCTQAAALGLALPTTLEKLAQALNLEQQKDMDGHRLMLQMAQPRPPRRDEDPNGIFWFDDDPERRERLGKYCMQDVAVERAIHYRTGSLSREEQTRLQGYRHSENHAPEGAHAVKSIANYSTRDRATA